MTLQIIYFRGFGSGRNEAIASFLGMYEVGPLIVLRDKLTPAKQYWENRKKQEENFCEKTFVTTIIGQVCGGLSFLHEAELVSPVLSLSTVLLDEVSERKLL